jgi:hypothetical protein
MADQINFTLKFAYDYKNKKARLNIDFIPEFSTELNGRTVIPPFNPKRLREALRFVEVGVIRRIVEHIKKEELIWKNPDQWKRRAEAIRQVKADLQEIDLLKASLKSVDSKKAKQSRSFSVRRITALKQSVAKNNRILDKHDAALKPSVEEMINNWESETGWELDHDIKLTSIGYEQMSAGVTTYSVQRVANTDVPPPKPGL